MSQHFRRLSPVFKIRFLQTTEAARICRHALQIDQNSFNHIEGISEKNFSAKSLSPKNTPPGLRETDLVFEK